VTVEFIEETHTYKLNNDLIVSSVTEILTGCGLIDTTWYRKEHAFRGRAVHKSLLYYLQCDLDERTLSPGIVPYLDAFKLFQQHVKLEPKLELVEKPMIHPTLLFAGTPDMPCELNGSPALIDFKTCPALPHHGIQLAAYKILLRDVADFHVRSRYVLQLKPDGKYKLHEFKDRNDERVWLSCLAIYNWKKLKGGKNGSNGS
jgi:hypothetical protein